MKRKLLFAGLTTLFVWMACSHTGPLPVPVPGGGGIVTLEAQTLPIVKTIGWNAAADPCVAANTTPPTTCPVLNYNVSLDNVAAGTPTGLTQVVTFTTPGLHTITVSATNIWGTGSPSVPLTVNIVVPAKMNPPTFVG